MTDILHKKIYDIETLSNCFLYCSQTLDGVRNSFYIHQDKNQLLEFIEYLNNSKDDEFIGFNNIGFDSQIIHYIYYNYNDWSYYSGEQIASLIYSETQRIISLQDNPEKYLHLIPEWKMTFKQCDLFKIKHYDSRAKSCSLKWLEFTFNKENIQEMPIHHSEMIKKEQFESIESYCWNDVEATLTAYLEFKEEIDSRKEISKNFKVNVDNASEPRCVKTVFVSELSKELGIDRKELLQRNEDFKKTISPFKVKVPKIEYSTSLFQKTYKYFQSLVINPFETKNIVDLEYYYKGVKIIHGVGGLHASVSPQIIESSETECIHSLDFTSFYPFIKITNKIYPPYLSEKYLELIEYFFKERKKHPKGSALNNAYKLFINGSFGLMNEYNSPIYYPQGAMQITITGQLYILKCLELIDFPHELIMINTDGFEIKYNIKYKERMKEIKNQIEKLFSISLEDLFYKKMIVRDVNNYIAISEKNDVKKKGMFATEFEKHKNSSFKVIPLCLEAYFVKNANINEFIHSHKNIYDFCGAIKSKSNFDLNYYYIEDERLKKRKEQKVCRYYVSKSIGSLKKDFDDGRQTNIHVKLNTQPLNTIKNVFDDINYSYYINEVQKIISEISSNQLKLF